MQKRFIVIGAICLGIIDALLKWMILTNPPTGLVHPIIGLSLHKNPGIAFNIPVPLPFVIVLSLVIIFLLAFHMHRDRRDVQIIGASTVIIGALGNMIDRMINGFTTDYIIIANRSVINISDLLIIVGAIILVCYHKAIPARSV